MTDHKVGRPPLPEDRRRVRLAGGPTVKPRTHDAIIELANATDLSIGEALDWMVDTLEETHINYIIDHHENKRNQDKG